MKEKMKLYFNERKDLSNKPIIDDFYLCYGRRIDNIMLSNTYSIIVVSDEILKAIITSNCNEINDFLNKKMNSFIEDFEHYNYEKITLYLKEEKKYLYCDNSDKYCFDKYKIRHIESIIGKTGVYYLNSDERILMVKGKKGYAFLLGCIIH